MPDKQQQQQQFGCDLLSMYVLFAIRTFSVRLVSLFSHLAALIIITKSFVLVYNKMAAAATVRLLSLVCGGHVSLVVSFSSLTFFGF